jgi:hypothetical protein
VLSKDRADRSPELPDRRGVEWILTGNAAHAVGAEELGLPSHDLRL